MPPELQTILNDLNTSLNAIVGVTDANDPNFLGEPWRTAILDLKAQLNANLKTLPDTDRIPAANEARWGLDMLKNQLLSVQAMVNSLTGIISAKNKEKSTALASIPTQVEEGVQARIKDGSLITKEAAGELVAKAKADGEAAGFSRGKLLNDRRNALALAGLPAEVVSEAPEALLLGEEAAFTAAKDAAKDRVTKLNSVGLTVASAQFRSLTWDVQDVFDKQLASFTEIAAAASKAAQSNNSATTAAPKVSGLAASTKTEPQTKIYIAL